MALIIIDDNNELNEKAINGKLKIFDSQRSIQEAYCDVIERELLFAHPFFDNPDVKEYLNEYDITYTGRYTLLHNWDGTEEPEERFVTWLNYPLQLACLALYYADDFDILITDSYLCCDKHLVPVLEKRDIYVYMNEGDYIDLVKFLELFKEGAEIRIEGKSSKNMTYKEFFEFLLDTEAEYKYLSRELDAKYFRNCKLKSFIPEVLSLYDYIKKYNDGRTGQFEQEMECLPDLSQVMVHSNGPIKSFEHFRRYPIHYLFHMKDGWKYISSNSVKYPTLTELLMEAVLEPGLYNSTIKNTLNKSPADKILVLVLDCDEVCDARRYWDFINFIAKYDVKSKCLEICDADQAIYEFHECLSESTDL